MVGDNIHLERFSDFLAVVPGLRMGGRASIEARAELSLQSFDVSSVSIAARLHGADIRYEEMGIRNVVGADGAESPMGIELNTGDLRSWAFHIPVFLFSAPTGSSRAEATGTIVVADGRIGAEAVARTGEIPVMLPGGGLAPDSSPVATVPAFRWDISGGYEMEGGWRTRVDGRVAGAGGDVEWSRFQGARAVSGPPSFSLAAEGSGAALAGTYDLKMFDIQVTHGAGGLTIPGVTLNGELSRKTGDGAGGRLTFTAGMREIRFTADGGEARFPGVEIHGSLAGITGGDMTLKGRVGFSKGRLTVPSQDFSAGGISGSLPFQWPPATDASAGKVSAAAMKWRDLSLGNIDAAVWQQGRGLVCSGRYHSLLLPGLALMFDASAAFTEADWLAEAHLRLPAYRVTDEIDMGRYYPDVAGVFFNGEVSLAADVSVAGLVPSGTLSLGIRDGRLRFADLGVVLDGISTDLGFADLLAFRSSPRQTVRIATISYGDIVATDFYADYQVESPTSLFVEQSRFGWCAGHVSTEPFRITPGVEDYRLTLYCDRLNLARVLEQLGAVKATGDGAVNGRIPLYFSDGRLTFQDGFLYSTPGGGGSIRVTQTEILTAGLPPGSPQYMQMDIAREALKDFDYSWVKLNLGTEADNLVMQLKFDGKPAGSLPFVYKRDLGQFMRVEAGAKGSNFQGIRLDVNFRLPLNEFLKYKDVLNLME